MSSASSRPPSRRGSMPSEECEKLIQLHYFHIPLISALHQLGKGEDQRAWPLTASPSPRMSPTPSLVSDSDASDELASGYLTRAPTHYGCGVPPAPLRPSSSKRKHPGLAHLHQSRHAMKTRSQARAVTNDFWELDHTGKRRKTTPTGG